MRLVREVVGERVILIALSELDKQVEQPEDIII